MHDDYVFKAKPFEVRAFNVGAVEDINSVPDWLLDACNRGLASKKSAGENDTVRYTVRTLCGMGDWKKARIGDWIVRDEIGALDVYDNLTIMNHFELVRKTTTKEILMEREQKIREAAEN